MPVKTQTKQITKPGYIKRAAGLAFLRGGKVQVCDVRKALIYLKKTAGTTLYSPREEQDLGIR